MKKLLDDLLEEKAPGPFPSFAVYHVVKALELVAKGHVGRGKLSEELKIGEGATRTLIERFKAARLVSVSRKGCFLTEKGKKLWNELESVFPQKVNLEKNELVLTECNIAVLVRDCGDNVQTGVEQRDAAMMAGARGATTLVFRNKKLTMPNMSDDVSHNFPLAFRQITSLLKLKENDVVVIGSANTLIKAEYGAWAAALTLVKE